MSSARSTCISPCIIANPYDVQVENLESIDVIHDSNGYDEEFIQVLKLVMDSSLVRGAGIPYVIRSINPLLPLEHQIQGVCSIETDFEVLLSATSCDLLSVLASQSASMGLLHFAVNVDHCRGKDVPAFLDRKPRSDVTQAIVDVVQQRNKRADIVIIHDTEYGLGGGLSGCKNVSHWSPPFERRIPRSNAPLSPRGDRSASRADKHTDKQASIGFNRINNIVSLINSETRGKMTSSSSCPGLNV
ncbi:glutamate receptor ionotropic, delta-1 [Trichonephila clavipes]|nr:glutamate receptor ionotropic, delta-1 [Trichonephila clavipes]